MNDAQRKKRVDLVVLSEHAMLLASDFGVEPTKPVRSERDYARLLFRVGYRLTKADRQTKVAASWAWAKSNALAWTRKMEKTANNSLRARAARFKARQEKKAPPVEKIEVTIPKIDPPPAKIRTRRAPKRAEAREKRETPFFLRTPFDALPSASLATETPMSHVPAYDPMSRDERHHPVVRAVVRRQILDELAPLLERLVSVAIEQGEPPTLLDLSLDGKPLGSLTLADLLAFATPQAVNP